MVGAPGSALSATESTNLTVDGTGFTVSDADEAGSGAVATLAVGEGAITVSVGDSGVTIDSGNGSAGAVTRVASGAYQMGFADINALVDFNVQNPGQSVKAVMMETTTRRMSATTVSPLRAVTASFKRVSFAMTATTSIRTSA